MAPAGPPRHRCVTRVDAAADDDCPRHRCSNIKEQERFGIRFFQGFNLVINALDNVGARKHVNRQCLAANVPLIEAGTTGYLGQAYPIQKGVTACFECNPPPSGTVKYPICE